MISNIQLLTDELGSMNIETLLPRMLGSIFELEQKHKSTVLLVDALNGRIRQMQREIDKLKGIHGA